MRTRREVVQGLVVSIGGATLLTACGGDADVIATPANTTQWRYFSDREMALVTRISDLIFPRTDTPSAVDANVPGYIDGLMADWADSETQQHQHSALADLDSRLSELSNGDFVAIPLDQAESILREFDAKAFGGGEGYSSYRNLKSIVTACYFVSEEGATQELKWVPAPGRWDPAVPVESLT